MTAYVFPGQGSQYKGMGKELFDEFSDLIVQADSILGYSIQNICLENPQGRLNQTKYTESALFVVNALSYLKKLKKGDAKPDCVAGHSLGEYNALFAAGVIGFETGIRLVKIRGELMSHVKVGAMAAVLGLTRDQLANTYRHHTFVDIDIANYNSPTQCVLSGNKVTLNELRTVFEAGGAKYTLLNVSAAFHSRYMEPIIQEYGKYLDEFNFSEMKIPIIANTIARPYHATDKKQPLIDQITGSVEWLDSIRYLLSLGNIDIEEIGSGNVLTKLTVSIKSEGTRPVVEAIDKIEKSAKSDLLIPNEKHRVT